MNAKNSSVNWGLICHLAGLSSYVGLPILGPLLVWLLKRKTDANADREGRESVNFNISFTIYMFVAGLLIWVGVGLVLFPVIAFGHLVLIIWAVLKANNGESVHYPLTLRVIN